MDPFVAAWLNGIALGFVGALLFDRLLLIPTVDAWRHFLRRRAVNAWNRARRVRLRGRR